MQEFEDLVEDVNKHLTGALCGGIVVAVEIGLFQLDVPVAEAVPDEVVELLNRNAELELLEVLVDFTGNVVEGGNNPLILGCESVGELVFDVVVVDVHMNKAAGVPELVREVGASFNPFVRETHIISGRVACREEESQRVGAVFVNDFERVDSVSEGFTHLDTVLVTDDTVDKNSVERLGVHLLNRGENHPRNPEEDYVVACNESAGREEVVELRGFVRPAES